MTYVIGLSSNISMFGLTTSLLTSFLSSNMKIILPLIEASRANFNADKGILKCQPFL